MVNDDEDTLNYSRLNFSKLHIVLSLIKYRISLAVTFTAVCGFLFFSGHFDLHLLYVAVGVFILSGGASALNQYMERNYDARMSRTMSRPIPAGKITALNALIVSIIFIISGLLVLLIFSGTTCFLLGLFNIAWYNFLYTNLKKVTPFAVVPGSLAGAVPVIIGWSAAGGYFLDPAIVFVTFFLFIWQIPHFWLILLKYSKEYEEAGFPSIKQNISPENLRFIIYTWMIATSVISLMFPLIHIIKPVVQSLAILFLNLWFVVIFTRSIFKNKEEWNYRYLFFNMNLYMLLVMLVLGFYRIFV